MKPVKYFMYLWMTAFAILLFAGSAKADLYWETSSVSVGIPGQSNGNSTQRYYSSPFALRAELGAGHIVIIRYDTMKLYSLDRRKKTYKEVNLAKLSAVPGLSGHDQKKMARLMSTMLWTQATPTDKIRTIAGYRCREYFVRVVIVNGEYWVSKDVTGYRQLKALGDAGQKIAEYNPLFRQFDIAGLVRELDGFPVRTVNHVMGGTVTSTLTRIMQTRLSPALFDVPRNYAIKKRR